MQITCRTSRLPLARVLALVALLCAGALQVQEAGHGHWHELDDSNPHCLVCKSTGGVALPAEAPRLRAPGVGPIQLVTAVAALLQEAPSPFDARGPPYYA